MGNDCPTWSTTLPGSIFQSTFPRGERRHTDDLRCSFEGISIHVPSWGTTVNCCHCRSHSRNFNPRSLVGNDAIAFFIPPESITFQSTFPRGERHQRPGSGKAQQDFNPRSLVGNDKLRKLHLAGYSISIHVPAWGTTIAPRLTPMRSAFQSTFPRGERLQIFTNILCFFMQ